MYLYKPLKIWNNTHIPTIYIKLGHSSHHPSQNSSINVSQNKSIHSNFNLYTNFIQNHNLTFLNPISSTFRGFSNSPIRLKAIELNSGFTNTKFELVSSDTLLKNSENIPIKITNAALEKLTKINKILQIQVESGGCSGFQYTFKLINENDLTEELKIATFNRKGNARVAVDDSSLQFLEDCIIDYTDELIRSSFMVKQNKSAISKCGCGHSFEVKIAF